MIEGLRLHRRQFFLSSEQIGLAGWRSLPLGDGVVFSHCEDLSVADLRDGDGTRWLLVGDPIEADPSQPVPPDRIGKTATNQLAAATYSWSGRWALISRDQILGDAGGLLPIFYDAETAGGRPRVSSSLALLSEHGAGQRVFARRLRWSRGMDWYAPPISRLKGIFKLLPSQRLNLRTLKCAFVDRFRPDIGAALSDAAKVDRLLEFYIHYLKILSQATDFVTIFLTGGLDSRTTFAAAIAAGVPTRCCTHRRFAPRFDFDIPRTLSNRHGIPYNIVERQSRGDGAARLFDEHCFLNCVDFERDALVHGQMEFRAEESTVAVKSGCWEVGRCFYHDLFPFPWDAHNPTAEDIISAWRMARSDTDIVEGLGTWLDWRRDHPATHVDWQDLYYIEQRMCGWLSAVEQSIDLVATPVVQPANCQAIFDLLLSFDRNDRKNGTAQKLMIQRVDPAMMDVPINGPRDRVYELKYHGLRIIKAGRELKHRYLSAPRL